MANDLDTNQEAILNSIAAAITTLTSAGVDINPYSVAREAEIDPVDVFNSKAAMDKVIAARGDAVTYSIDRELSLQFQETSLELEKAIGINQELYDRGSELAEKVVELEAKVAELEQEAEQLAMQLQNAWSVGYQKGLAEGKEKATSTGDSPAITPKQVAEVIPAPTVVMSARDQAVQSGAESAVQTGEEPAILSETLAPQDTEYVHIEDQESDNNGFTVDDLPSHDQIQPGASAEVVGYNDKVFNAVKEGPAGPKPSDLYSALSFKQIETVYQYSTVQGRVGANLYFEPLPSAQSMEEPENQSLANSTVQPGAPVAAAPAPEARPVPQPAAAPSQVEPEKSHTSTPVESEQKQAQKQEIEPTAAAEQAERRPKKMPNISFDPPDEPIVGASSRKRIEGMADSFADTFGQDPFTQSLTDVPSLDNMLNLGSGGNGHDVPQAKQVPPPAAPQPYSQFAPPQEQAQNSRTTEVETSSALTALPASEPNDELDLDKLDIFEGLEDIEELSNIEVIEDVVLPGDPSAAQRSTTERATAIGGEDLRDLIKTRIKQAHEQPAEADAQGQTAPSASTTSAPATAAAAAQGAQDASALSAEAIRQGVRNKFIGGKSPTVPPPGIANPAATAAAGSASAAAPAAGPSTGAGAGAATASTDTAPGAAPGAAASQQAQAAAAARVPPEVRKNCMILGVRPEDLTVKNVIDAWKAQITAPGVHPDQGGDHETALYLNIAKETLVKYIEAQAPKLGKKFGQQAQARETPKAPFTMRQNPDKGTDKK